LGQGVVHVTEPSQTGSGALSFTAAGSDLSVVFVWFSPSTSVSTAADQFVFWTLTAIISQTTNLTGRATVLVLAVFPIVEWFSTARVFGGIISTWASFSSVLITGIVNTGNIIVKVDGFNSVFTVCTWTVVGNGLDVEPFVIVTFLGGPSERPHSMSGFVPVIGVFSESHSESSIALANSSSAVEFDSFGVVVWSPTVVTDNLSLTVVLLVAGVPDKSVRVPSDVRIATSEIVFGTGVTVPQLLANFVDDIDWWTSTGYETVSTFWQAPASVETVSRDTFIFWL